MPDASWISTPSIPDITAPWLLAAAAAPFPPKSASLYPDNGHWYPKEHMRLIALELVGPKSSVDAVRRALACGDWAAIGGIRARHIPAHVAWAADGLVEFARRLPSGQTHALLLHPQATLTRLDPEGRVFLVDKRDAHDPEHAYAVLSAALPLPVLPDWTRWLLENARAQDLLIALPARSYLIIGHALNAPLPLPEALSALAALADLALPCDPPPVPLDATPCLRPDGAVIFRRHGERIPDGESRLPADRNWCLMRCADHGWEFLGALPPPSAKTLAIARELGHTLIAQASESCEVYAMHKRVMDAELEAAAPAAAWKGQPVPPLEFLRSYRAIAGALRRTTTDIGYVVARALEQMAAQDW